MPRRTEGVLLLLFFCIQAILNRWFLLSPAFLGGRRGEQLRNPHSTFAMAREISTVGAPIADVYAFVSGLYFRGKITYARRFARNDSCIRVITPTCGLVAPDTVVTRADLEEFASVDLLDQPPVYRDGLQASLLALDSNGVDQVVLLGSIATGKYGDLLSDAYGPRLVFPAEFVGRGDMSRGGLLLRAAAAGVELAYTPFMDAVRRGPRPPRLPKA